VAIPGNDHLVGSKTYTFQIRHLYKDNSHHIQPNIHHFNDYNFNKIFRLNNWNWRSLLNKNYRENCLKIREYLSVFLCTWTYPSQNYSFKSISSWVHYKTEIESIIESYFNDNRNIFKHMHAFHKFCDLQHKDKYTVGEYKQGRSRMEWNYRSSSHYKQACSWFGCYLLVCFSSNLFHSPKISEIKELGSKIQLLQLCDIFVHRILVFCDIVSHGNDTNETSPKGAFFEQDLTFPWHINN